MKTNIVKREQGYVLIMVLIVLCVVLITAFTLSSATRTQLKIFNTINHSSIALNLAESGLAIGWTKMSKVNNTTFVTGETPLVFTTANGWNITVNYTHNPADPANVNRLKSTASRTINNKTYRRSVEMQVTPPDFQGGLPPSQFQVAAGGNLSVSNGSYDLHGQSWYATTSTSAASCNISGPGTLASHGSVTTTNASGNYTKAPNQPEQTIPTPDWTKFTAKASKVITISSNTDITNDVKACKNGEIIVVRVKSGSPQIILQSSHFADIKATIVVIKDNPTSNPTFTMKSASFANSNTINAFIDGNIDIKSVSYQTAGVLYATGNVSLQSLSADIRGGIQCQGNVTFRSASLDIYDSSIWQNFSDFFNATNTRATRSQWREVES